MTITIGNIIILPMVIVKEGDICQNLIDIWHVLRHLQYNISDNIDKNLYDVRASEPYQGGTEPLMRVRVIEKPEL